MRGPMRAGLTGPGWAHLAGVGELERHDLGDTAIDDDERAHLSGYTQAFWLELSESQITTERRVTLTPLRRSVRHCCPAP